MSSLFAQPLLVVNLGGEMMNILKQRLDAHDIKQQRAVEGTLYPADPSNAILDIKAL